jgi:D-glycero-D-manno-heptose 1,7-bisphosphate phosphatase
MKRPAVFFDRDNTLLVSDGFLGDPAKVQLVEGAADAVAAVRTLGYATVVISNQSGVARGMFGEDDVRKVNARLDELLRQANPGAIVDRHEYCPFHPQAKVETYRQDSTLRKPRPGMIFLAADALALDVARSWVVGDAPRDVAAGKAAGCRTILVRDSKLTPSPAADEKIDGQPDHVVGDLGQAVQVIAQATPAPEQTPADAPAEERPSAMRIGPAATSPATPSRIVPPRHDSASAPPSRTEVLLQEVLLELRRRHDHATSEFSVGRLLAAMVQVGVFAALFFAYLNRGDAQWLQSLLLLALTLQAMAIAMLMMGSNK